MGPLVTGTTPREQRLAAAGRVAAALLHEFRNVLAPIANLAFVLERQADDPARVRELAQRLAALTQVRSRVADRLRDFVRQDAARFPEDATVDLAAVAREAVALCADLAAARSAENTVPVTCDAPRPILLLGDAAELRTAVLELLLNALDAQPSGGSIEVRVTSADGIARLEVRDHGAGVAPGMAEHVFDPFISGREEPDAGLGLSAAWGVARRHDGDLTMGSDTAGGVYALLTLPMSPADFRMQEGS